MAIAETITGIPAPRLRVNPGLSLQVGRLAG
jgi:hypothetical protein